VWAQHVARIITWKEIEVSVGIARSRNTMTRSCKSRRCARISWNRYKTSGRASQMHVR
jgi:hypothetical protein